MPHARKTPVQPKSSASLSFPRPRRDKPPAIESVIHTLRGERVILDADLARIYGVTTKVFNQAVKRNHEKFPSDFMFILTRQEVVNLQKTNLEQDAILRSQIVTASKRNLQHLPFAFTEHGAIMAANILNSPQAVQMSVFVVRAFVSMRGLLTDTRELAGKLATLERELTSRLDSHETAIFDVLQRVMLLLDPPATGVPEKEMGFHTTMKPMPKQGKG
jgi:hypothetical protein